MSEPTKIQQVIQFLQQGITKCSTLAELQDVLQKAVEDCKSEQPVKFGCHCDLDPGQAPDACVTDDDATSHYCIYADGLKREGKTKWDCPYWKPVGIVSKG